MRLLLVGLAGAALVAGALGVQRLATHAAAPAAARSSGLDTAAVTRRDLVSRERVSGTLGYDKEYDVVNQYVPGLSAAQATSLQDAVASAQTALDDATAQADVANQVDASTVASDQAQLAQDQQKKDQQATGADQAKLARDQNQQQQDQVGGRARVDQARGALTQAQDNLTAARAGSPPGAGGAGGGSGGGGGTVVTWLPAEGAVVDRGQTLYGVAGRPIPLLIGDQPFGGSSRRASAATTCRSWSRT